MTQQISIWRHRLLVTAALLAAMILSSPLASAQEIEPRRWSHVPVGANFAGVGYAYSDVDILFNPTLELEDVAAETHTAVVSYVRGLDILGKTGRVDVLVPYTTGRWQGLVSGEPASVRRQGFNDPKIRFAVNLIGPPAQRGADFRPFTKGTIVGVAVEVTAPFGEYQEDELLNLGANRWVIRPQLGVVHSWGKWAAEVTGSLWWYSDNDEFLGDKTRKQDQLAALQGHLLYTFRPGLWASLSTAYGAGAESTVDGIETGDEVGKVLWAASFGFPINRTQGIKLAYLRGRTTENVGNDSDRFLVAYSIMWGR